MDSARKERLERQRKITDTKLSSDDRRAEAVIEKLAIMNSFRAQVMLTKQSDQQPSGSLMSWMAHYLVDEDGAIARGQALTQLLWLPPHQRVAAIEYLKGDGVYNQQAPGFVATLKNVSGSEIKIEYAFVWRPVPAEHAGIGFVDGPTGHGERRVRMLGPGETINMTPHFAIMNLQRHCLSAHDPVIWGQNASIPQRDSLVEVGYRCLALTGSNGEPIDSDAIRRRVAAEAEAEAGESTRGSARSRRTEAA